MIIHTYTYFSSFTRPAAAAYETVPVVVSVAGTPTVVAQTAAAAETSVVS